MFIGRPESAWKQPVTILALQFLLLTLSGHSPTSTAKFENREVVC
jgi:hypothetical protein